MNPSSASGSFVYIFCFPICSRKSTNASKQPTMEGEENEPRQCQLCPASFMTTRTLKKHYETKHGRGKDDELVQSIPKSPKKACKRCGKSVANPWAHKKTCKARKKIGEATTSGESANPSPIKASTKVSTPSIVSASQPSTEGDRGDVQRMRNEEFIRLFRSWMTSARGNSAGEKTINDYTRLVVRFMEQQTKERSSFRARHWISFQSGNFMPLVGVGAWIPRGTKISNANKMVCAFKHLLAMIRANLTTQGANLTNFAQRMAHLDELHRDASALARKYKAGLFEKASQPTRKKSIDVQGWRSLIKAYHKSAHRASALKQFAGT